MRKHKLNQEASKLSKLHNAAYDPIKEARDRVINNIDANKLVGYLLELPKYTYVDSRIVAAVVRDAVDLIKIDYQMEGV